MAAEKLPGAALAITMLETFVPRGVFLKTLIIFRVARVEILVWVGETWSFGKGGGVSSKLQVYLPLNSVLNGGGVEDDPNTGGLKSSFCSLKKCRSSYWSFTI